MESNNYFIYQGIILIKYISSYEVNADKSTSEICVSKNQSVIEFTLLTSNLACLQKVNVLQRVSAVGIMATSLPVIGATGNMAWTQAREFAAVSSH